MEGGSESLSRFADDVRATGAEAGENASTSAASSRGRSSGTSWPQSSSASRAPAIRATIPSRSDLRREDRVLEAADHERRRRQRGEPVDERRRPGTRASSPRAPPAGRPPPPGRSAPAPPRRPGRRRRHARARSCARRSPAREYQSSSRSSGSGISPAGDPATEELAPHCARFEAREVLCELAAHAEADDHRLGSRPVASITATRRPASRSSE